MRGGKVKKIFLLITFLAAFGVCGVGQTNNQSNPNKATKAERDAENRADNPDTGKAAERAENAARVLSEIMNTPDKGIPSEILSGAKCVIVIPGVKKAGFIVGARYGRGYSTCRTSTAWTAPAPVFMGGGSYGAQIGAEGGDLALVGMNDKGGQKRLPSTFEMG